MMDLRNKIKILFDKQDNLSTKLSYAYQYARIVQDLDESGNAKKCLDSLDKFLQDKSEKNKSDLKSSAYATRSYAARTSYEIYRSKDYEYEASINAADSAADVTVLSDKEVSTIAFSNCSSDEAHAYRAATHATYAAEAAESAGYKEKLTALTNKLNEDT